MTDFWKNFTYCIKIERYFPKEDKTEIAYVTKINNSDKTFEFKTEEKLSSRDEIQIFKLERAVDLMNSMTCNGFTASIQPFFKDSEVQSEVK